MDKRGTFLIIGIIFWVIGAFTVHYLGPIVFDGGLLHVSFWVINFIFGAIGTMFLAKVTGRTKHDMLAPVAIMAMPAMVMDGLAVTTDALGFTHIYVNDPLLAAYTGGFLLFAFWSLFFFALMWHRA